MKIKQLSMLVVLFCLSSNAIGLTINATDTGWYNSSGHHYTWNKNYYLGSSYNDFFVFDLAGVSQPITSASLRLYNPTNGYRSDDGNETLRIFDVNTPISSLLIGTGGTAAYYDLGMGTSYGSVVVDGSDVGSFINIVLNSAALSALNAAGGLFAFGGSLVSADDGYDMLFGWTHLNYNPNFAQLSLQTQATNYSSIPEPGLLSLVGLGFTALFFSRRGRRAA